ncbi:MAG TPA: histidine kinase [Polyangia bacterium]|jgi:PAS domain S-box-containing protein|nr:histidine kinase [Polyangia bacterium]
MSSPRSVKASAGNWAPGFELDETEDVLRPSVIWRLPGLAFPVYEAAIRQSTFRRGEGLPGRVWADKQPIWREEACDDHSILSGRITSTDGLRSTLLFPITTGKAVYGVLQFLSVEPRPVNQSLDATWVTLGRQIGQYIERVRAEKALLQAERRFRDELEVRVAERTGALEAEIAARQRVEDAPHASEAKILRLFGSDVIGTYVGDNSGRIYEANDAFLHMLGYSRQDLAQGKLRWDEMTPLEWQSQTRSKAQQLLETGYISGWSKEYLHKSGRRVPVLVGGTLLEDRRRGIFFVLDNTLRGRAEEALAQLNRQLKERVYERTASLHESEAHAERVASALAASEQQLRSLAVHLQTVREEERADLAREIHDVLGQELTGLKMDAAWVARRLGEPHITREPIAQRLDSMQTLMDSAITTVRRIATDLRPGVLDDLGLVAALEWQAHEFERRSGLTVAFSGPKEEIPVDRPNATAVFRIFQELLTNVARHAQARTVEVSLTCENHRLVLEVRDDGRGITEAERSASRSLGLLGIRERAAGVSGACTIIGQSGKGTVARLDVPMNAVGAT